jgi:hypothetical protein
MIPGSKQLAPRWLFAVGLPVLLCLVVAAVFQVRSEPHFFHHGVACVEAGSPFAILAALLFAGILWKGAGLSPRWTSVMVGALAGLVSTSVLEIHCPDMNMWHILVWHFGIPFVGAFAGLVLALLGETMKRMRV